MTYKCVGQYIMVISVILCQRSDRLLLEKHNELFDFKSTESVRGNPAVQTMGSILLNFKDACPTITASFTILRKFPEKVTSILLEMKIPS